MASSSSYGRDSPYLLGSLHICSSFSSYVARTFVCKVYLTRSLLVELLCPFTNLSQAANPYKGPELGGRDRKKAGRDHEIGSIKDSYPTYLWTAPPSGPLPELFILYFLSSAFL